MRCVKPPHERFFAKVDKTDGCWNWTACTYGRMGYGKFSVARSTSVSAHCWSYEYHHGDIPKGMVVMHTCDNPKCVNPDHLVLGTRQDNQRDMKEKGRAASGERHHNSVLTEREVLAIREMLKRFPPSPSGSSLAYGIQTFLSKWFGVHQVTISNVYLRKSWGWH